ncbi:ATP-binding cassette domain-containing protein, partial [Leucobacter sp. GX24907]
MPTMDDGAHGSSARYRAVRAVIREVFEDMVFSFGTKTSPIPLSGGVQVAGLGKSYGDHRVLSGVDLAMDEGEVVSIIGPSGGGKSTFLRCLNYLEVPTEGTITIG